MLNANDLNHLSRAFQVFILVGVLMCYSCTGSSVTTKYPGAEWPATSPASQGIDETALLKAIRYLEEQAGRDGVNQLVIVRHGSVVWQGDQADSVHGVWSMTKSFVSTALGLLIDDGKCDLDTYAYQFVPSLRDNYSEVTLRHFATMTSGYRAVGDEPRGDYAHGPSRTPFQPSPDPLFAPGARFAYWDSAMNQFANVLTQIAGESLDSLIARRITRPIGLADDQWSWGDFGTVNGIRVVGGAGNNNTRLNISALAMARFGYLYLHQGRWKDRQLLSEEWVHQATTVQVPATLPIAGPINHGPGTYGYNWWVNGKNPDGGYKWPNAPSDAYNASGYNNNDLFVIPSWDMVIVRLGLDQGDAVITDTVYDRFFALLSQAL